MKTYTKPSLEMFAFEKVDILTTSNGDGADKEAAWVSTWTGESFWN